MNEVEDNLVALLDAGYDVPDRRFYNGFEAHEAWLAAHALPTPVDDFYRVLHLNALRRLGHL